MNYSTRLKLAAQALARDLAIERANESPNPIAIAIYEARLTAVTGARQKWSGWRKSHPKSTREQRRAAKRELGLPVTRRECLAQIERIHQEIEQRFKR